MWLYALIVLGLPAALSAYRPTRENRSLWGQLSVVSLPLALLFVCAMVAGAGAFAAQGARLPVLAFSSLACLVWCLVRTCLLYGRSQPKAGAVHPLFWAVAGVYALIQLADVGVSPIWDAGLYFSSLLKGVAGFNFTFTSFMSAFSAQGHLTQLLILLYAPGQYLFPGSVYALNLTTLALSLPVLFCYYRLMQKLFPECPFKPLTATALLALIPQLLAFVTGINPDFGVWAGLVLLLYCHAYKKPVLAVAAALLLLFSKETGIILYGGFGLGVLLFNVLPWGVKAARFSAFWRRSVRHGHYLLPLGLFVLNFLGVFGGSAGGLSNPDAMNSLITGTANRGTFRLEFLHMLTILNQVLVINFNWIATVLILAGLACWITACMKKKQNPAAVLAAIGATQPVWGVAFTTLAVYLLFALVYVDFPLMRYNMPTLIALPTLVVAAVEQLPWKKVLRFAAPGVLMLAYLCCCWFTADPGSRFAFPYSLGMGQVRLLDATNHTGFSFVCERHTYNRQYLNYSRLLDDIIADSSAGDTVSYASYGVPSYALQFFGNTTLGDYRMLYSPSQKRRVWFAPDAVPIPGRELFAEDLDAPDALPEQMHLITLPYQNEDVLGELLQYYTVKNSQTYSRQGMQITVLTCVRQCSPNVTFPLRVCAPAGIDFYGNNDRL